MIKENEQFMAQVPTGVNEKEASLISQWTQEAGTMLPKSIEQILALFAKGHSVLVFDKLTGLLVSHAGITYQYGDGSVEIGAVISEKENRRRGAATFATQTLLEVTNSIYPERKKFALANEVSLHLFLKIGGKIIACSQLSDEVWEPCRNCPNLPKQEEGKPFQCCDTPVDLTGALGE